MVLFVQEGFERVNGMQQECVIQIDFVDRLGLGYEVFEVLKRYEINLLGMEATPHNGMLIKLSTPTKEIMKKLINEFKEIHGVTSVFQRSHLLYEKREHELRTILDSVNEGVIAVDREGRITHINDIATQILHCIREEVLGKNIGEYFQVKLPLQDIVKNGKPYTLKEVRYKRDHRVIHYLTSGVPILDDQGRIIGAVATINDYKQVEALINKVGSQRRFTTFDDIIYQSQKMRRVVETAKAVAKGNSTILLRGESGTGKELFARAIHMESSRSQEPFIAINCAALPSSLLESELFGYEEGAFTGATKSGKKGLFEQASGGTLFLDEIGEISLQVQVRLLRVLQEGTIRRVGGSHEIPIDVRIIAATHRNLEQLIQRGDFREDLYYRLNVIPIHIPSLHERTEDIPLIVHHLICKICAKLERPEVCLTQDSIQLLMEKSWPGNVRQLENILERIVNVMDLQAMTTEEALEWALITANQPHEEQPKFGLSDSGRNLNKLAPDQVQVRRDKQCVEIKIPIPETKKWPPLKRMVSEVEKQILLKVLEKYPTSRKAGKILSVSSTTVLNKMKGYGIEVYRDEEDE
jgi:transcriptional regulator of aroF, aroG, tyrA and aromatic amino acid transport